MIKNIVFLIIFQICLQRSIAAISQYYDIPSYYGHFSLQYFDIHHVTTDKLVLLQYHFAIDASYNNQTIFYAKEKENCIYQYHTKTSQSEWLIGKCGTSGNLGGSRINALFNQISSIAYFESPSISLVSKLQQQKFLLVKNKSCDVNMPQCLLQNSSSELLNMSNIRIVNKISIFQDQGEQKRYLIIADTNNHCIKSYSFENEQIQIIAGKCGEIGFLDGPLGYNKLSFPTNIGISRQGVVYFFDSGNQYMRIIKNGNVDTLLLGACKECMYVAIQLMIVERLVMLGQNKYCAMRAGYRCQKVNKSTTSTHQSQTSALNNTLNVESWIEKLDVQLHRYFIVSSLI